MTTAIPSQGVWILELSERPGAIIAYVYKSTVTVIYDTSDLIVNLDAV